MTLPRAHMCMRNTLFCLKHQVISFVRNRFVYKLIGMDVYNIIVKMKAELLITRNGWFIMHKTFFYSSVTALWSAVH